MLLSEVVYQQMFPKLPAAELTCNTRAAIQG